MNIKRIKKRIYYQAIKLIPKNNLGDRFFSLVKFVKAYRRLPNNKRLLSNYLFDRHNSEGYNPLRAYVSDKEFVKDYVAEKIGMKHKVPTIKVLHHMQEVRGFSFPQRCCVKPTHLSGRVILRENGEKIDFDVIQKWLNTNWYDLKREKNYRFLTPKIIVEPLIFDRTNNDDYKFFCYKGRAKFVQVDIDRWTNYVRLFFDREWNQQEFTTLKKKSIKSIKKPGNFESMLRIADCLSKDFEFIRVDLYTDGEDIYVGELTNWPGNGIIYFVPKSSEETASKLLFDSN